MEDAPNAPPLADAELLAWAEETLRRWRALPAALSTLADHGLSYTQIETATGIPASTAHRKVRAFRR